MDIVFDIDSTLADPSHRLHFIKDMAYWVSKPGRLPGPDWESFLSPEALAKDTINLPMWVLLDSLVARHHRVIFITGRKESTRDITEKWFLDKSCAYRGYISTKIIWNTPDRKLPIYMRKDGDRRPSHVVKEEGLMAARADGYAPTMAFEDRASDAEMWRRNGLLCCQINEGDY